MIKRYSIKVQMNHGDYDYWYTAEDVDGELVKYEDHIAIVEELKRQLESADGEVSDLMQTVADLEKRLRQHNIPRQACFGVG